MKSAAVAIFLLLPFWVGAQATTVEWAFIARANVVRDSLGLPPLVLMWAHREVSAHHAGYVARSGLAAEN